jgi:hypothetical protein
MCDDITNMFVVFELWNWMGDLRGSCLQLVVVVVVFVVQHFLESVQYNYSHPHVLLESGVGVAYDLVDDDVLYLYESTHCIAAVAAAA